MRGSSWRDGIMSSYTIYQSSWYFEECWALQKLLALKKNYPWLSWDGMVNESEMVHFGKTCQGEDFLSQSFEEINEKLAFRIKMVKKDLIRFLNHCLSENHVPKVFSYGHAITRWSYQWMTSRLGSDCLIMLLDAHDDLGEPSYISNRWMLPEWASRCILIGNWAEGVDREDEKKFLTVIEDVDGLWSLPSFVKNGLSRYKGVFVTIDLDYWPHPKYFPDFESWKWVLSNYWTREMLVGHGRTILQLLQMQNPQLLKEMNHVGQILFDWFEGGEQFKKWRRQRHQELKESVLQDVRSIFEWLEAFSLEACYIDVVEYCGMFDADYMTKELVMNLLENINEL